MTHPRRPLLKRACLWMAAVVLLLASYVLGAPFVCYVAQRVVPASEPFFTAVYAPLVWIAQDPDAPGHSQFVAYCEWTQAVFEQAVQ